MVRVQIFGGPFEGLRFRWVAPLLLLPCGAVAVIAGAGMTLRWGLSWTSGAVVVVGALLTLGSVAALIFRIRARFTDDRACELRRDLFGDIATLIALVGLGLAVLVWGGHGLWLDASPARTFEGRLTHIEFYHGRGSNSIRIRVESSWQTFHWDCRFDCRPWSEIERIAAVPTARLRLKAIGDRVISLEADGRTVLRPGPERRRWISTDLFFTGNGLLLTLGLGAAVARKARDLTSVW